MDITCDTYSISPAFRSELSALDLEQQGTGDGVLKITAKTIEIAFAKSKTSTGEPEIVAVPRQENAEAVKAVEKWIELAGVHAGEPILRRVTKGGAIDSRSLTYWRKSC